MCLWVWPKKEREKGGGKEGHPRKREEFKQRHRRGKEWVCIGNTGQTDRTTVFVLPSLPDSTA